MTDPAEAGQESGSQLREKLEAALNENKTVKTVLAQAVVKGLRYVTPEDLKDVAVDQIEAKAAELESTRKAAEDAALAARLGVPVEDLDAALAKLSGQGDQPPAQQPATRSPFAFTGALGGQPTGSIPDPNVRGVDRIQAAVAAGSKK
jgi:hypothetical protein